MKEQQIKTRYIARCPMFPNGAEVLLCQGCSGELPMPRKTLYRLGLPYCSEQCAADECDREVDRLMAMSSAEIRAELEAQGVDPDKAAERIKEVIREAVRSVTEKDNG